MSISFIKRVKRHLNSFIELPRRVMLMQEALGRIEARLNHRSNTGITLRDHEFRVYSQWGEDGIIDAIVQAIDIPNRTFVEFGVENYTEANTLFLMKHRNWCGMVIDGSPKNIASIRDSEVYWRYGITPVCSFITKENINHILRNYGVGGDIGLLSIDIDGNDYWVAEAINVVRPRIVVLEYNSLFGKRAAISVPYIPDFVRPSSGPGKMCYGASIVALTTLMSQRGYSLVAGNSAGNNIFFVRDDCLGQLKRIDIAEAYAECQFRECANDKEQNENLSFSERQKAILDQTVVETATGKNGVLKDFI
jgi:hypothetical protein